MKAAGAAALHVFIAVAGSVALVGAEQQRRRPAAVADADYEQLSRIAAIEDSRNPSPAELSLLIELARGEHSSAPGATEGAAVQRNDDRRSAEIALLLTLRAHAATGDQDVEAATDEALSSTQSAIVLGQLPYTRAAQVERAETKLLSLASAQVAAYGPVAAAFEVLARKHRKLHQLQEPAIEFLQRAVERSLPGLDGTDDDTPRAALAALMAAGRAGEDTIRLGLRDRAEQVRRIAATALNTAGADLDPAARTELTRSAFGDPSHFVRYEAVRAWANRETRAHGCGPLVQAMSDESMHVVLAALDALGEQCLEDDVITDRLVAEARTPPTIGDWQREAHAFVALARRSPERSATTMPAFVSHVVWQVRMYAARAAASMKDVISLERLAYDRNDNVREATLGPLRALKQSQSDAVFLSALARSDYQLLRTAAISLQGAPPDRYLAAALAGALERVTAEKKDTSRDTRLALLERLRAMGGREQLPLYKRLLKDFDPRIAAAAAEACTALASSPCAAAPVLQPRPPAPTEAELKDRGTATVEMDNGRRFFVVLNPDVAPLACVRFKRLVRARYYDGLTFHRVVPNFVIQGGSPGANEYSGADPFMRDELGGAHRRGSIGISTRGRDTGDAQIFINLVDNPRLDFEYTVFASVSAGMDVVDRIQEGARIARIYFDRPH